MLIAGGVDHILLVLIAGLAADAVFGDPPRLFHILPHPVTLAGDAIGFFDRKLNRAKRSEGSRRVRGILTVIVLVPAAAATGWAIQWIFASGLLGLGIEIFLVALLVAQRSLFDHVATVARALETGGLAAGRAAVRHIVGRDPESLDAHGVVRAAIESLAENFSDGVVAPVFWFLLFGLPGLFAYKMANTLDSMIGHKSPRYRAFGWAAARFDDLTNLVPAPLSGLLLAAAAIVIPGSRPGHALIVMLRDARKHRSPNAGWPEGAMAGALSLALAGPRRYAGVVVNDPWIGDGRARAAAADIGRALQLYMIACVIEGGLLVAVWLAFHLRSLW